MKNKPSIQAWMKILSLIPLVLGLILQGWLTPEKGGLLMVVLVLLLALNISSYQVLLPVIGVLFFILRYTNINTAYFWGILSQLFVLSIILFGFYIMFRGIFGNKRK